MHLKKIKKLLLCILSTFIYFSAFSQQQPIPDWVKDIGGIGESKVSGVAVDKFDNIYVAGNFRSSVVVDQSGVSTPISLTSKGDYDIFIAKYTPDGRLIWAKSIGGSGLDQANNLTVDDESNVIFGGQYSSALMDCDPGAGTFNINNAGGNDAFIVKLDRDGNFKWAKNVGGTGTDFGHVVAADRLGNVIFVGSYSANINLGSYNLFNKGSSDGYVIKYDKDGNILWAYGFGLSGADEIRHVITNANNEIVIMGYFESNIDINPKGPPTNLTGTVQNYFIAKYTESGQLIWANKVNGPATVVSSLAVGPNNDIYLTGVYNSSVTLTSPSNNISLTATGGKNLFVGKYNNSGTTLWARNISGITSAPYSYYITADVDDNVYIGGYFDGTLIFGDAMLNKTLTYHGIRDTFFGKYDGDGTYKWAFNFGSPCSGNFGHKIAVDSKKNVLLGGSFCNTVDFNPGTCDLNITAKNGTSDGYISKYNQIKFTGDPNILTFEIAEQSAPAVINAENKTISIKVKAGTDLTKLTPTLTTDIGILSPLSGVVADFSQPKTYIISSNCVTYSWIITVTVDDSKEVSVCSGVSQVLVGETGNTKPATTYAWEIKDSNDTWINAPNEYTSIDYVLEGFTNYTADDLTYLFRRKVFTNNITLYESPITVSILPITTNNIITASLICNSATFSITGSIPQGANHTPYTYQWQQSDDNVNWSTISDETNKDITAYQISETKYFKRLTFSGNCSSTSNILKIDHQAPVTTSLAGNNLLLCNNNTTKLAANIVGPNETGTWTVVSPSDYNPFNGTNINDPTAQISNIPKDIDIILKWTISQTICQTNSESTVKIHNYSVPILMLPAVLTINEGQSAQIPSSLTPSNDYTFSWSPSDGLDNPNILSPFAKPNQTTIYHLKISYGNNCTLEKDIKIVVNKITQQELCGGQTMQLTGDQNNDNNPHFQWQAFELGLWVDVPNENRANFSLITTEHFDSSARIISYRRKIMTDNITYFDSKYEITIFPLTNDNIISTVESIFCNSSVNNLSILGSKPNGSASLPITYSWETSDEGINWTPILNAIDKDLILPSINKTTYFRRVTSNGKCTSLSNNLKIQLTPPTTIANAGENKSMCGDLTTTLNANKPGDNEVGTWSVISPTNYSPFTPVNIHNPNAIIENLPLDQQVTLQWEITNSNCNTTTTSEVKLISYRNISVQSPSVIAIDFGKKVNLGLISDLTLDDQYTLDWSPKIGLDNANILSPNASPTENTVYSLKINYGKECVKVINIQIIVLNSINIPTSFSPNGDGTNDLWEIRNINNYPGSKISVYNRYGTLLYQTTNYVTPWDGTHKGKILPVGTYYYVILLKDKKNSIFNGSITLIH